MLGTLDELWWAITIKDIIQGVVLMCLGFPLGRWYVMRSIKREMEARKKH